MSDDPRVQQLLDELHAAPTTPEVVCGSCPELLPEVRKRWGQICRLRARLDALFPSPEEPTLQPPQKMALPRIPGYEVVGEIGQGGMGIVYHARDCTLDRPVALKFLQQHYTHDPSVSSRFLYEAQITGQLQHPGIPPVHQLGTLPDGRPFLAMKLIQGRTLDALLREQGAGVTRWLAVFEAICQAVGYAHSKGVIHRDLKPSNIMVGAFGEVQVMDWGLAKRLGERRGSSPPSRRDDPDPDAIRPPVPGQPQADLTGPGSVLGTPAFMAPEQAIGAIDRLDRRSDVFGLGAILCVLLTGQPPFVAADAESTRQLAARARLDDAFARLDGCGAEPELIALARRCLSAKQDDRPADAGVLAAAVAQLRQQAEDRARQAEMARARVEVQAAEQRKRRRLQMGLAAAVLLLVLAGGLGAWLWQQHRQARAAEAAQRRQEADAAVGQAMREARLLLRQARSAPLGDAGKLREALAALKAETVARTAAVSADVQQQAEDLTAELEREARAVQRDRRLLAALLEVRGPREGPKFRTDDRGLMTALAEPSADEQFAAAFREWDATLDVDALSTQEAAARLRGRPPAVRTEVIAALDEWASERRQQRMPQARWRRVADLAIALDDSPNSRQDELRQLLARGTLQRERALGLLALALRPVPVPFDARLGRDRQRLRRLVEGTDVVTEPVLGLLTLARALLAAGDDLLAERLLEAAVQARPHEVTLHQALGQLRARQGRWREAVECYVAARALRPELGVALAEARVNGGRVAEGLALFERLTGERPDNPWLRFQQGNALYNQSRYKEAETAYRAATRLNPEYHQAHNNLGSALINQGRYKEAETAYRTALRLKPDLPEAHNGLGSALNAQDRDKEAETAYRATIRLKPDSHLAHTNLGTTLSIQGRYKEAEDAYRTALRLKPDFPGAHVGLGDALNRQGRHQQAEAACRQAIRFQYEFPAAHFNLGVALNSQGRHQEAEAAYRTALRLKHDYHQAHTNLGNALNNQRRPKEAEAAYREAIRLKPDSHQPRTNLGNALINQGRYKEAEAAFRAAIRLKPDLPEAHYNLGIALDRHGRLKEAEAAFREAIRLKHDYPEAHCNLGHILRHQGHFVEALQSLRRGHALGSPRPGWPYPSAAWARHCQRLVELDQMLPAVLNGNAEPASAQELLELASLCQMPCKRLHATAARFAAAAFRAHPRRAGDLQNLYRFKAARSAAVAAAGQAEDARFLPDRVALKLRAQAYRWLQADLALFAQLARQDDPKVKESVRQWMIYWRQDLTLASVRDRAALARLDADERQQWRKLWQEVDALLGKVAPRK
jgi:serine/threonine-protein kinase